MTERCYMERGYATALPKDGSSMRITRGTRWGNPFKVQDHGLDECLRLYEQWLLYSEERIRVGRGILDPVWQRQHLHELKGKRLYCTCKPDDRCHGDLLVRLADAS